MSRSGARDLRAYRRTKIIRWAFGALVFTLLGIQSMVSPMTAQASAPTVKMDVDDANGMGFDGFKDFTSEKCVVVPYNVNGSQWYYYCRKKNGQDFRAAITILKQDGDRQMGRYDHGDSGCNPDTAGWGLRGGPYYDLVDAQEAWAGTTPVLAAQYKKCDVESLIEKDSRTVQPQQGGMSAADWYGPRSFTAGTSQTNCDEGRPMSCQGKDLYKPADNPCAFFTKSAGQEDRYVCRDPRVQTPCPSANLSGKLLQMCAGDNKQFYDLFGANWKSEKQDPCKAKSDGTSACDAGKNPGGATDEDVVSNLVNGVGDVKFTDDPIGWTKQELSKASAEVLPWWILADDPVIAKGDKYQTQQTVDFLTRYTNIITYTLVVISVIVAGVRMVIQRDGAPAGDVARSLVTLVIVAGLGVTIVNYLVRASATFTNWFVIAGLNPASHGQTGGMTTAQAVTQAVRGFTNSTGDMNFFVFLLAALFMIVGSIVQYFYMVVRFFLVITLTGTLAMAAAATNTEAGKDWFRKHIAYLAAFILVKPAGIIIFVSGARLWAPSYGGGTGSATPNTSAGSTLPPVTGKTMLNAANNPDVLSDAASRSHATGSGGALHLLSMLNPLRGFEALGGGSLGGTVAARLPMAADGDSVDTSMNMATQFRGLFIILLITLLLPAMLRIVVPLVSPAAGSEGAGLALATGALSLAAKGAVNTTQAGAGLAAKGAQLTGQAIGRAHQKHRVKSGRAWSEQAKKDWSGNWQANAHNNWDRTFQSEYARHEGTFGDRLKQRTDRGQVWSEAYQATYQETYQAAATSAWQKVYQDTFTQTWQQDEQRRNPGQPIGPAPDAPAQNAPVFGAAPETGIDWARRPGDGANPNKVIMRTDPPARPSTPAAPGAAPMPDNP
ncbi:MAG: hypothetical protein HOV66_29445 [Streptomycetaceae bacterium]|jgi:hypothetical protein|nr:hypothetical protein [Streptomycetaceae bacterium]NUS58948.1 hypothetical protein [Streptomycetaceae bacterium]